MKNKVPDCNAWFKGMTAKTIRKRQQLYVKTCSRELMKEARKLKEM
jgi:hypothetical protein